jgi:hypothetical protein
MNTDTNLLNKLSEITIRTSDGIVTKLGHNTAIFYYKTLVENKFIIENIKRPFIEYGNDFYNYLKTSSIPINMEDAKGIPNMVFEVNVDIESNSGGVIK